MIVFLLLGFKLKFEDMKNSKIKVLHTVEMEILLEIIESKTPTISGQILN